MVGATHGGDGVRLLPQHIVDLGLSGISEEQALMAGIRSIISPQSISSILHWKKPAIGLGPCLLFPFLSAAGQIQLEYARLKPDTPRTEQRGQKKGKTIKYESPIGKPNRAYFPIGIAAALVDLSALLVITEGEKKALEGMLAGFPSIGLVGVWGWQQKRERRRRPRRRR
jgi:hypothetical protein